MLSFEAAEQKLRELMRDEENPRLIDEQLERCRKRIASAEELILAMDREIVGLEERKAQLPILIRETRRELEAARRRNNTAAIQRGLEAAYSKLQSKSGLSAVQFAQYWNTILTKEQKEKALASVL